MPVLNSDMEMGHPLQQPAASQQKQLRSLIMFSPVMTFLDRAAMSFVVLLAAAPMLAIAARASFL
jgi:hypothetical protein